MAFNCTAHRATCFQEKVNNVGDKWWVLVPIGYDPDSGPLTYYFLVQTYASKGTTEFAFCLMARNNMTGATSFSYDSAVTNAIVPKACRQHLSAILNYYSREVIAAFMPPSFFMETYCINLPPAALVKYDILTQIFAGLGYTVTPTPTTPGKYLWVMNRAP